MSGAEHLVSHCTLGLLVLVFEKVELWIMTDIPNLSKNMNDGVTLLAQTTPLEAICGYKTSSKADFFGSSISTIL